MGKYIPNDAFRRIAWRTSHAVGSPSGFVTSVIIVMLWSLAGPAFGFSDTWQLIINTITSIVTFLMVFIIQSIQNRDSHAIHKQLNTIQNQLDTLTRQGLLTNKTCQCDKKDVG